MEELLENNFHETTQFIQGKKNFFFFVNFKWRNFFNWIQKNILLYLANKNVAIIKFSLKCAKLPNITLSF